MDPLRAKRRGSRPLTWIIFLLVVGLLFVLNCSGLLFPMWDPAATLNGRLSRELKVSLPPGATVTHAARVATMDPAAYFRVTMPSPDASAFIASVRAAAGSPEDEDPSNQWFERTPDWWKPSELADVKRLDTMDFQGGYTFYYSESAGTLYVFWFRT